MKAMFIESTLNFLKGIIALSLFTPMLMLAAAVIGGICRLVIMAFNAGFSTL